MANQGIFARLYDRLSSGRRAREEELKDSARQLLRIAEEAMDNLLSNNPYPVCMTNADGEVLWCNQKFELMMDDTDIKSKSIMDLIGIKQALLSDTDRLEEGIELNVKDRSYRIFGYYRDEAEDGKEASSTTTLFWQDISREKALEQQIYDENVSIVYISVDNFDELLSKASEEKRYIIGSETEKMIRKWGSKMNASVTKYRSSQYIMAVERQYIEKQKELKFSILDEIRTIETQGEFPVSVSIGIGVDGKSVAEQDEYAVAALDLALGRGGDQAVIKYDNKVEYYGGRLQTVEKRNKGKSRLMAHALKRLMDQSSNVIIMGHHHPDMDALGAAIGVASISKSMEKDTYIIMNTYNDSLVETYKTASETGRYTFIDNGTAKEIVNRDSLLIVVDTNRPSLVECPELLNMSDKLVVLDHHRRTEDYIDNALLTYIEAYASSTSELVTEILQYSGDKKEIDKLEADALLAGMTVDTNRFSMKTGVRTFEAAAWLRRMGADSSNVRQLFQTDLKDFKQKAQIVSSASMPYPGMALAVCKFPSKDVQVLNSQAADELLNIKGIKASFVLGKNEEDMVVMSARSLGDLNVQTIMEKLGGGGNLTKAGAQLKDVSLEEAEEQLKDILKDVTIE